MKIMKQIGSYLLISFFILLQQMAFSQVKSVALSIGYSAITNTHDVYLHVLEGMAQTAVHRTQFNAQITIVSPIGVDIVVAESFNPLRNNYSYQGTDPLFWQIGSIIENSLSGQKYSSVTPTLSPTAQYNNLKEGDKIKLFSIAASELLCRGEIRLYENGKDPNENDPGMNGGDFSLGFTMGSVKQLYSGTIIPPVNNCASNSRQFMYADNNGNNIFDNGDSPLPNVRMKVPALNRSLWSKNNGQIDFIGPEGEYEAVFTVNYGKWKQESIAKKVNITDHFTVDSLAFVPTGDTPNVSMSFNHTLLRCNTKASFSPSIQNVSSARFTGKVVLDIDPRVSFENVTPNPDFTDDKKIVWEVRDLGPGVIFKPNMNVSVPQAISNQDSLRFSMHAESTTDVINTLDYSEVIRCSYDPNDKRVWPNRKGDNNLTEFDETLRYTIRFQNNGNDTAFAVRILDVLDRNLDKNTLIIKDASHEVYAAMNGDSVFFVFDPIILPDSATNYIASQGYVTFDINMVEGLSSEVEIFNTANIYFDRNPAIRTNTTLTTAVEKLPCPADAIWIEENQLNVNISSNEYLWYDCITDELIASTTLPHFLPTKTGSYYCKIKGDFCISESKCISYIISNIDDEDPTFKIYPNPTSGELNINAPAAIEFIEIIDLQGKEIFGAQYLDSATFKNINIEQLTPATYIARVVTADKVWIKKIEVIK